MSLIKVAIHHSSEGACIYAAEIEKFGFFIVCKKHHLRSEPLKHPFSSKLLAKKFQAIQDFILKVPSVLELEGTKMVVERRESELRQSNGMISIQDQYFRRLADERTTTATTNNENLIP
ncbi:hypothetical protein Leryth_006260 [Lithospermum erythrorhizon]|nr:hypothetical protein Leryth_006260 [Lithospermum erythrorhizon]